MTSETRVLELARSTAAVLLLVAVVAAQAPGRVVADTKLDLTQDPWGLMARALHLWDPTAAFGQLQNQGYGYLFPMGPFFGVMTELFPDWVAQRLWWLALLVAGYLGMRKVAAELGIGPAWAQHLSGLAFALSPRVLSTLGPISSEAAPLLLTPWVLLPVLQACSGATGPRRAAARSALAVLLIGGVNATATVVAVVPTALWLLSRRRFWRAGLTYWWVGACALATLWWLTPLLVLGRYSPPFLDWIEDARVVTTNIELLDAVRGGSHWLGFVVTSGGPWWDAGFTLATDPWLVLATSVTAALGMSGLVLGSMPHRGYLVTCLLLGVCVIGAAHGGTLSGLWAQDLRGLLDGPLAPLRNVHKFDPLVRLPLCLGLAHLLGRSDALAGPLVGWTRAGDSVAVAARTALRSAVSVLAVGSIAFSLVPAVEGRLAPPGTFQEVPPYWSQTAAWLAEDGAEGRSLLVPASNFAEYFWGRPLDEPFQVLAQTPWAVRNGVPLAPANNIRMLDAVESRLRTGSDLAGAAETLRRSGVRYLVLRNDLDARLTDGTTPAAARASILATPGVVRVAAFGPQVALPVRLVVRAVEVFDLGPAQERVVAYPAGQARVVSGASEALVQLGDAGLLDDQAVVFAGDAPQDGLQKADSIVTDTFRSRQRSFGAPRTEDLGPTQTAAQIAGSDTRDYLPWPDPQLRTVASYDGLVGLSSSTLAGPPSSPLSDAPAHRPYAALDQDDSTAWVALATSGADPWLELELDGPMDLAGTSLLPLADRDSWGRGLAAPASVTVRTDAGESTTRLEPWPARTTLQVPAGQTTSLRLTLHGFAADSSVTGIADLALPDLVAESLTVPGTGQGVEGSQTFAFAAADGGSDGCLLQLSVLRCHRDFEHPAEESTGLDRSFDVAAPGSWALGGALTAVPGEALDQLLDSGTDATVVASSRRVAAAAGRPGAVLDGDPRTAWSPGPLDRRPTLTVTLAAPAPIEQLRLVARDGWFSRTSPTVRVVVDGSEQFATPNESGRITISPRTGREIRIEVLAGLENAPVSLLEVSELELNGSANQAIRGGGRLPCGQGPPTIVDGSEVPTSASWSPDGVYGLAEMRWQACEPVALDAGAARITVDPVVGLAPSSAVLEPSRPGTDAAADVVRRTVQTTSWESARRTVALGAGVATLLTTTENVNLGWRAEMAGRELQPVVVDGWRQGWVVPAGGSGTVTMSFAPDSSYRVGLLGGGLLALGLLPALVVPDRRRDLLLPASTHRGLPRWSPWAAGAALGLLLAGWVGLAVGVVAAAAGARARHVGVLVGGLVVAAAALRALSPIPGARADWVDPATRVLVLVALVVLVSRALRRGRGTSRRGGSAVVPPARTSTRPAGRSSAAPR